VLNYFKGGPMDGRAYLTAALLSRGAMQLPIPEYRWTPDTITSQKTGAVARVWVHQSVDTSADVQGAATSEEPVAAPVATDTGETQHNGGTPSMSNITGASLRERRDALKISRPQLAEKLGTTPSKLYRIEADGARTTAEEKAAVDQLLTSLEGGTTDAPVAADPS
jgi:DNA-binding transcriptional regulator YiaG